MIKAILACDEQGGIAKNGTLPWPKNNTDLMWFKNQTTNHVVVMGSSTWLDPHMPCPMPNRTNVVVSKNFTTYRQQGAHWVTSGNDSAELTQAIKDLEPRFPLQDIWVIGGANIISQTLGAIKEFYISRIPGTYECDTFLPLSKIETLFERVSVEEHPEVTFEIWRKREAVS